MNYFKCVLSAFNITIKRKRTYNRSRFPYIQSSTSEAVLSTRSNIKYLVPVTINPIRIYCKDNCRRHDSCGDISRDSEHGVDLYDGHPPAQLPHQTRPLDQLQRRHPHLLLPQHHPRGFQHHASG